MTVAHILVSFPAPTARIIPRFKIAARGLVSDMQPKNADHAGSADNVANRIQMY
jgi:hypothetical protein